MERMKAHDSTWEKLDMLLNSDDSIVTHELNPKYLNPLRKNSLNSVRLSKKKHGIRSISASKDLSFRTQRPGSSSSGSRAVVSLTPVSGLTIGQIQGIYTAKCLDLEIPVLADQEKRFFKYCTTTFKYRNFTIREAGLGANSAKKIGEAVRNNQNFAFLDLGKNSLKDEGSLILVKTLKKSMNIVHLDLSSNEITAEGSDEFLKELIGHESLASLDISSSNGLHQNKLGLHGAKIISQLLVFNPVLAFLNISGAGLGAEGFEIIMQSMGGNCKLISLNVSNNNLGSRIVQRLTEKVAGSEIKEINIGRNKIGNEGCEFLSMLLSGFYEGNCGLLKLDLSENEITTPGLSKLFAALRINSQLNFINLQKNNFSKGLSQNLCQFLSENGALDTINLSSCELKPDGLQGLSEGLQKNLNLKSFLLSNNFLQDKGCEIVAAGLSKNKFLKLLDLSNNKIKDKGGVSLAKALTFNKSFETLILNENNLKDDSGQALTELARYRNNIIKISLEFNPLNLKYIHEMKIYLSNNLALKQKNAVTKIQEQVKRARFDSNALEDLHDKIALKEKEKNDIEEKLKKQGNKLEVEKDAEVQKLQKLKEEYKELRVLSLKMSTEIEFVHSQMNVKTI